MSQPPNATQLKSKGGLGRVWRAMGYTLDGLRAAYVNEPAFRQEVWVVAPLMVVALLLRNFSAIGRVLLTGSLLLILIVELVNSAIEANTDHISLERHPLAKRAKDMGSAAVFLAIVNAVFIWIGALWTSYGDALWNWLF